VSTLTKDRSRTKKPEAGSPMIPQTFEEFSRMYPIYEALTRQLELVGGPYPLGATSNSWTDKKSRDRDLQWLDQVDQHVQAVHLRHFLIGPGVAREDGLRLFLLRHLSKPNKLPADRDKIDLLLVQYFVLVAPQDLIAGPIEMSAVAKVLEPVLGEVEAGPVEVCAPLDRILEVAQSCRSLREIMEQGLLEQGKIVKNSVGGAFYDPAALISICRFNFLLRRTFIQWLHADLRAIGMAVSQLEKRGVKTVDCRRAGLSSKELISKLRQFHQHWKPPFQNDYSQDSAFQPYEQLMCLREDLEEALNQFAEPGQPVSSIATQKITPEVLAAAEAMRNAKAPQPGNPASSGSTISTQKITPEVLAAAEAMRNAKNPPAANPAPPPSTVSTQKVNRDVLAAAENMRQATTPQGANPVAPQSPDQTSNIGMVEVENLEEKIWEQLIATPPSRGRSMTTVTVDNTRILLSAWEVAAFVSDSGQESEELRRLIVARAMLSTSIERRKRLMDFRFLHKAIAHARAEIPRFQERVDQLKRTQKTDGAVNLGISLKRLISLVDEAEQLQKGSENKQEKR
jgi:hypothetical protein